jgi:hypothetical protein
VKVIVPDDAPEVHPPAAVTTLTASLFPPPEIRTWYPAALVVSMPTGQGVSATVACDPPVNALESVCVQLSAVVA